MLKTKMWKSLTKFGLNFECWAVQKRVNLVDLAKSFQTSISNQIAIQSFKKVFSIYLQNSASTQPRTSLSKFAEKKCQKLEQKLENT